MASAAALGHTASAGLVRSGVSRGIKERLSSVQLICTDATGVQHRAAVFLVKCRADGFLALLPATETVKQTLDSMDVQGQETAIQDYLDIPMETARGRGLGTARVLVVDFPWHYLDFFLKAVPRGQHPNQILFTGSDGTIGRPEAAGTLVAADAWVGSVLDEDTAQEYTDAIEDLGTDLDGAPLSSGDATGGGGQTTTEVVQLRARLQQLEAIVMSRPQAPAASEAAPAVSMLSRPKGAPSQLSAQELQSLKDAVGPPPRRLGKGDAPPALQNPQAELEAQLMAEVGREVTVEDPDELALGLALSQDPDPLRQLVSLQLKQTAGLLRALAPRPAADPLTAILGGSDSAPGQSASSSVNVKGYAAREAYLKQLEDEKKLVDTVRRNARTELGISESREEPSLLRSYLESRIPVGDLKTMGQVGFLMAWGWEQAALTGNQQMLAFCARGMM